MNKALSYIGWLALPIFIVLIITTDLFTESERSSSDLQFAIEWVTAYVLPWIFLYWFVKLVKEIRGLRTDRENKQ